MAVCLAAGAAPAGRAHAEEAGSAAEGPGEGRYVREVYMAYGESEEDSVKWLESHGWEPIRGDAIDFNAGKASSFDDSMAVVMGIRRTDDKHKAVTDMAVMNMKGGYSFPKYEKLLEEKKAEINEFINMFRPVLDEYRINYGKTKNDSGKKRAELAHEMLNKFFDGGRNEPYAKNDTGGHLGDLFLDKTRQEGNNKGIDLEQVIMESSGAAVTAVETALSLAADSSDDTWLERAAGLTGDELSENLPKYVPEAEGADLPESAVTQFLSERYGDAASSMSSQWYGIHDRMLWYENYNEEHGLWPADSESDADNGARIKAYFDELKNTDPESYERDYDEYYTCATLYVGMYNTPYEGDWGETLGDLFNPADGRDYGENEDCFLPLSAALSDGQRAAIGLIPLSTLILLGFQTENSVEELFPNIDDMLGDAKEISIYSGINRGIFRGGVALTSEALMESSHGYDPFNDLVSFSGIYNITCYAAAIASVPLMGAGIAMWVLNKPAAETLKRMDWLKTAIKVYGDSAKHEATWLAEGWYGPGTDWESADFLNETLQSDLKHLTKWENELNELQTEVNQIRSMSMTGRILTGIGGAILIGAAFAKGYQMYRYYNKKFTQIPTMIVDEADIVTYTKDEEGKEVKNINFDQYVYYQAVKCNRLEVGKLSDWQDGVEKYEEWGCGDVADLNGDFGQEWLALYTVKSPKKGDPILADSLTLQYGSRKIPGGCTKGLHLFAYSNAADLGDTAWSFNNKKGGVYFFWDEDTNAFAAATASAFGTGHLALAGFGGLILGILGATLVITAKRRKDEPEAA